MKKIKICGIKTLSEIEAVNQFHISYIGFIFVSFSPRYIKPFVAKALKEKLKEGIKVVGVFKDASVNEIIQIAEIVGLDIIQLHGNEKENMLNRLPYEIWKVISVENKLNKMLLSNYSKADGILFDTKIGNKIGGTGQSFDWDIIKNEKVNGLKIVAGGIGKHNIKNIFEKTNADIIDLNSCLEINGVKTYNSIKEVINVLGDYNE